jgi:hypothetical protein
MDMAKDLNGRTLEAGDWVLIPAVVEDVDGERATVRLDDDAVPPLRVAAGTVERMADVPIGT